MSFGAKKTPYYNQVITCNSLPIGRLMGINITYLGIYAPNLTSTAHDL